MFLYRLLVNRIGSGYLMLPGQVVAEKMAEKGQQFETTPSDITADASRRKQVLSQAWDRVGAC